MLQNAVRAVVEFNSESSELPKVKILICKGREDVIIKVVVVTLLCYIGYRLHLHLYKLVYCQFVIAYYVLFK